MARPTGRDVRAEALRATAHLIGSRGVTGFSVGDVAERVGVRAPSIHHHFPHKTALVAETIQRYRNAFRADVDRLDSADPADRLRRYARLFALPTADGRLCVCGAAIASWDDLDDDARRAVRGFLDDQVEWVRAQLHEARAVGRIRAGVDIRASAVSFVAALEGALLLARTGTDPTAVVAVADTLLEGVLT